MIAVPDFGVNARYIWGATGYVSIISQSNNQASFHPWGYEWDPREIYCTVRSLDGTEIIYLYKWNIKAIIPVFDSQPAFGFDYALEVGEQVTFIFPNYGSSTYGVTYTWSCSSNLSMNASNQTATFTALSSGPAQVFCFAKFNGQTFNTFNSNTINIYNPSGGGGGGGGGGDLPVEMTISPNPSNGKFTINLFQKNKLNDTRSTISPKGGSEIIIFDSSQSQVYRASYIEGEELDIQDILPKSGLYIVHIKSGKETYRHKIFIEK